MKYNFTDISFWQINIGSEKCKLNSPSDEYFYYTTVEKKNATTLFSFLYIRWNSEITGNVYDTHFVDEFSYVCVNWDTTEARINSYK